MDKLLIIVRHGDRPLYGGGHDPALTELGVIQIRSLREVINAFVSKAMKAAGDQSVKRLLFSFSDSARARQSIRGLSGRDEDIIVTDLFITERRDVTEPMKIVEKVMGLAEYYKASVVVIVAHGEMPAVVAETAHESVTGKKLAPLMYTREACGYIVNMTTGEVTPIRFDDLDKKQPLRSLAQKPLPKAVTVKVPKYAPPYEDDDIPF